MFNVYAITDVNCHAIVNCDSVANLDDYVINKNMYSCWNEEGIPLY